MESNENAELLEGVVISNNGTAPQYMIQRLPENAQLLGTELLQQHNGLVVDLENTGYIPVSYSSDGILSHDLTDDDRNLAAALVAVQLSQQQKQQQLNENISNLDDQPILLTDKEAASLNNGFLHIVSTDNIYLEKHGRIEGKPDAKEAKKALDDERLEQRSSRKSLPHKKRISRKLKSNNKQHIVTIQCSLCEQTFSNQDDYGQHELMCQTTITPVNASAFSCQLCTTVFQDQLAFFEHLKSHYEPQQNFAEKSVENEAEKDSILSTLLNLTCIQCNKTFRRQKSLEAHMRDVHQKVECEFSETEDLMEGIKLNVGDDPHEESDTKSWYKVEEIHQTEEDLKDIVVEEHICQICQQPFPLRAILLQHLVTCRASSGNTEPTAAAIVKKKNSNKKKPQLQCPECERTFSHRNSLIYHMRSHTGIRPHQCDQCGKSFFASSALKVHLRLHSGDKPYNCTECGKNFRQWGDLKYHVTSIHSNEKQFQCEYCGKDFARKYSLIVHRRIHTGEKNYKCEYCGKTFRASSYLQNHRRIHTGEKPHECETCGKPFRVRSDMKRHMRTHIKTGHVAKLVRVPPTSLYTLPSRKSNAIKVVKPASNIISDGVYELNMQEEIEVDNESGEHILGYDDGDQDVRDANTLYVMIS